MLSVAQSSGESSKFAQDFEDYRKACRERYMQQASFQTPIPEEAEDDTCDQKCNGSATAESNDHTATTQQPEVISNISDNNAASPAFINPMLSNLRQSENPRLSSSADTIRNPNSVEGMKQSKFERRNSFSKFISGVFNKKVNSPKITSEKKKLTKEEKYKEEQDARMAALIATLEFEGKSDQEIQTHLFHIRDQAQFGTRRNSFGDFFKTMTQAFKDEFSTRRQMSVHVAEANPFYAAPPAHFMQDEQYSYEDLVALENVPRGVKCLEHLPVLIFEGQELPSAQTTCAVCMMEFEKSEELRALHCTHHFHKECIDKWLSVGTTCPVCKSEVEGDV